MNKIINALYPKGWRWLGVLTVIALLAAAAGYAGTLIGLPVLPAKMVLAVAVCLVIISVMVVSFVRGNYRITIAGSVIFILWLLGQLMYWSQYWVV